MRHLQYFQNNLSVNQCLHPQIKKAQFLNNCSRENLWQGLLSKFKFRTSLQGLEKTLKYKEDQRMNQLWCQVYSKHYCHYRNCNQFHQNYSLMPISRLLQNPNQGLPNLLNKLMVRRLCKYCSFKDTLSKLWLILSAMQFLAFYFIIIEY